MSASPSHIHNTTFKFLSSSPVRDLFLFPTQASQSALLQLCLLTCRTSTSTKIDSERWSKVLTSVLSTQHSALLVGRKVKSIGSGWSKSEADPFFIKLA